MTKIDIKLFADGADLKDMVALYKDPRIVGFTTNPTLMRKAGITDYQGFAREVLKAIPDRPVSLEVFDDDNDDKADRAIDFADSPKDGAMGLLWEKDTLFVTGDGGLRRFVD